MGASSKDARKKITYNALQFISKHYKTKLLYRKGTEIAKTKINGLDILSTGVVAKRDIKVIKKDYEKFNQSIVYNKLNVFTDLNKPIGYHVIKDSRNNIISRTDLYSSKPLSELSFTFRMLIAMSSIVNDTMKNTNTKNYPVFTLY